MSEWVKQVSEEEFEEAVIKSDIPVLVDFWAEWCGPCVALGPTLERVAQAREGKIKIVKVNVEDAPSLAAQFNVRNIPFMAFIKDGQKVGELAGNRPQQEILSAIDAVL